MTHIDKSSPTAQTCDTTLGKNMYDLMKELFPICRSITGNGVRLTLNIIKKHIPLKIFEVPSGTPVFDWIIPNEWNIDDAYIEDKNGNKIVDFTKNNLHVVGYSTPVDAWISLADLQQHLHSLENQPDAIPYVTSYYKEYWGFCITHNQRMNLKNEIYHVYINSSKKPGSLTYGECIIPGNTEEEIFLSTYICHPSMANNELSGPVVLTYLTKWLCSQPCRYTYRVIFIPETIGSITYMSKNVKKMKKNVVAGFNISCVGDERSYSYVMSRYGDTLADRVVSNILLSKHPSFVKYSFLDRASDEKQYCSPGIDLPLVSICRSKYGTYPEYHTSLDNLDFVTPLGLQGSYELLQDCIQLIERNKKYKITCLGEPQLGKRGLYPNLSFKDSTKQVRKMMDFIAYADGKNDLIDISNIIHVPVSDLYPIIETLLNAKLLES